MKLTNKFNEGTRFLLCTINIFSRYAWVVPLKEKKSTTISKASQEILNKSSWKPNKIWADKRSDSQKCIQNIMKENLLLLEDLLEL